MAEPKAACPAVAFGTGTADYLFLDLPGIRIVQSGCGVMRNGNRISLLRSGAAFRIEPGEKPSFLLLKPTFFLDFYLNDETAGLLRRGTPVFSPPHELRILPERALLPVSSLGRECLELQNRKRPGYALAVLEKFLAVERLQSYSKSMSTL